MLLGGCSASPAPTPSASSTTATAPRGAEGYGLSAGDGPIAVNLWTDLSCPWCKKLEAETGALLADAVSSGRITLTIHLLNFVSAKHNDATQWSTRAGGAMAAVADAGKSELLPELYRVLQSHQVEGGTAPTDAELLTFVTEAGVTADVSDAVNNNTFGPWIQASNDYWIGRTVEGTTHVIQGVPDLQVAGKMFDVKFDSTDAPRLEEAITAAAAG